MTDAGNGQARDLRRELTLFLVVVAALGAAGGIFETTFNNFLSDTFEMGAEARGRLEFPRELPGFLVTVLGGMLFFLSEVKLGTLSAVGIALGMVGLGLLGTDYGLMIGAMILGIPGTK